MSSSETVVGMRGNVHAKLMAICCLAPVAILIAAVFAFGLSESYLWLAILLLCPLIHFLVMSRRGKE